MSDLILRKLTTADESAFVEAINQWDHDSGFIFVRDYKPHLPFYEYVELLNSYECGENLQPGYVPDTSLFGFVNGKIVGRLAVRHSLNDFLLRVGGHIGYGIVPPFRRKGYATAMLKLALPIAKRLGIKKALITCDDNNVGSIKTIEANGGILENSVVVADGKPLKRRYWIEL